MYGTLSFPPKPTEPQATSYCPYVVCNTYLLSYKFASPGPIISFKLILDFFSFCGGGELKNLPFLVERSFLLPAQLPTGYISNFCLSKSFFLRGGGSVNRLFLNLFNAGFFKPLSVFLSFYRIFSVSKSRPGLVGKWRDPNSSQSVILKR